MKAEKLLASAWVASIAYLFAVGVYNGKKISNLTNNFRKAGYEINSTTEWPNGKRLGRIYVYKPLTEQDLPAYWEDSFQFMKENSAGYIEREPPI